MLRLLLGEQGASCCLGSAQCIIRSATGAHREFAGRTAGVVVPKWLLSKSSTASSTSRGSRGTSPFLRGEGVSFRNWAGTWTRGAGWRSGVEAPLGTSSHAVKTLSRYLATSAKPSELHGSGQPPAAKERRGFPSSKEVLSNDTSTTSSPPSAQSPSSSVAASVKTKGSSPAEPSEEIVNLPNLLTLSRILSVPFLGHLILTDRLLEATALLFVAGCTDLIDGWLARKWNAYTVFGSIADPAADKLLMTVMVATLGWKGLLPPSLAVLILARDVGLVLLAFRIRYVTLPRPMTLQRYFNPKLPSAQVQPTQVSKYNTFLQLLSVGGALLVAVLAQHQSSPRDSSQGVTVEDRNGGAPVAVIAPHTLGAIDWASILHYPLLTLWILTAGTTIYSGWGYFVGGAGYRNVALGAGGTGVASRIAARMKEAGEKGRRKLKGGKGEGE